jgi:hypothetical protein
MSNYELTMRFVNQQTININKILNQRVLFIVGEEVRYGIGSNFSYKAKIIGIRLNPDTGDTIYKLKSGRDTFTTFIGNIRKMDRHRDWVNRINILQAYISYNIGETVIVLNDDGTVRKTGVIQTIGNTPDGVNHYYLDPVFGETIDILRKIPIPELVPAAFVSSSAFLPASAPICQGAACVGCNTCNRAREIREAEERGAEREIRAREIREAEERGAERERARARAVPMSSLPASRAVPMSSLPASRAVPMPSLPASRAVPMPSLPASAAVPEPSTIMCDVPGCTRVATIRCPECKSNFCKECDTFYHRTLTAKNHIRTLLNINELEPGAPSAAAAPAAEPGAPLGKRVSKKTKRGSKKAKRGSKKAKRGSKRC